MKKLLLFVLVILMSFSLSACGAPSAKCEHLNTTTKYKLDGFSINKTVTCDDCEKDIEKGSFATLSYAYNKELLNENGIKVTLQNVKVNMWGVSLILVVEGTSEAKRTFQVERCYVDGFEESVWVYVSEIANGRKSVEEATLYNTEANDFIENPNKEIEFDITIMNPSNYKNLSEKTIKFNLNEYVSIEELTE